MFKFRYVDDRKKDIVLSITDITAIYMEEQEKKEKIEAALAKAEFYSRMSHDMRTPMNGILEMRYRQNTPAPGLDFLSPRVWWSLWVEESRLRVSAGQEAVDCFQSEQEHAFDIILMDIRMPVMDGLEATKRIRASGKGDALTIPIVAMTT